MQVQLFLNVVWYLKVNNCSLKGVVYIWSIWIDQKCVSRATEYVRRQKVLLHTGLTGIGSKWFVERVLKQECYENIFFKC